MCDHSSIRTGGIPGDASSVDPFVRNFGKQKRRWLATHLDGLYLFSVDDLSDVCKHFCILANELTFGVDLWD